MLFFLNIQAVNTNIEQFEKKNLSLPESYHKPHHVCFLKGGMIQRRQKELKENKNRDLREKIKTNRDTEMTEVEKIDCCFLYLKIDLFVDFFLLLNDFVILLPYQHGALMWLYNTNHKSQKEQNKNKIARVQIKD